MRFRNLQEKLSKKKDTHLSSLSSSPKKSRKTEPQTQARLPLTTMMVDELTDKNIPVPPPHSIECLTVSQAAIKIEREGFEKCVEM